MAIRANRPNTFAESIQMQDKKSTKDRQRMILFKAQIRRRFYVSQKLYIFARRRRALRLIGGDQRE